MPRPRVAPAIAAVALALAATACREDPPPPAAACSESSQAVLAALERAPAGVALPDGSTLAACIDAGRTDADMQRVGLVLHRAAEELSVRMREDDPGAATQLGYLVGATQKGASRTNGVMLELQRRIEMTAGRAIDASPPGALPAFNAGMRAGAERG